MSLSRRTLLELAALGVPFAGTTPRLLSEAPARDAERSADLVIIGGGLGGCAAALAACRAGLRVVCTEATDWIGGQVTSQAVPPDEHPWIESFGCTRSYREFRDGVRAYYSRHYPLTTTARNTARLNPGNGSVSRLCHEPRVALAVLHELLAPFVSGGQLRLLLEHAPVAADLAGDRVRVVTVSHLHTGRETVLAAPYFIDATDLGDLLPLTKTEFVIGAESQKDTGEPRAPAVAQPLNQQAFTWCFAVDHLAGEDHTIEKPTDYDFWRDYVPQMHPPWPGRLLSWAMSDPITLATRRLSFDPDGAGGEGLNLFVYRRIADPANFLEGRYASGISLVNWPQNDYWLGPLLGVDTGVAATHRARGKDLSLSLLYWMQTEAPRPDGGAGWKGLRLRDDVVGTADGLAKAVYVRESRRIKAEVTVTELHVGTDARVAATGVPRADVTAASFPDSVGIGSYRIDLHPSTSGVNYVDISSLPFQIPLGALIPQRVENLIPACKNIGTTHLTNGCYRLHPVEWNIGEAAGLLVAQALAVREPPRRIRSDPKALAAFQDVLRRNGLELEWPKLRPL
ncbi:putative FAD-binding dehydrogenase [Luteitalea pratensis]|uniref:Putative FAD-binding dehydrogenase n=1 Tax=Luteitalea pratensis TaxID=1855912 RepID=A0A143PMZ9_LUTPR|nr:FAD-dependent oxidoreductase [Luteitalea pratensis]AMY09154.1 putative FAD-binding dehydrogenase [Luteitalea pratensis]